MFRPRLRKVATEARVRRHDRAGRRGRRAARRRLLGAGARGRRRLRRRPGTHSRARQRVPEPPAARRRRPARRGRPGRRARRPVRRPHRRGEGRRAPPRGRAARARGPRRARRPGRPPRDDGRRPRSPRRPRDAQPHPRAPSDAGAAVRPLPQRDVFVLASGGENFGLVAAEAAAAGTPVVVSDRTGVASPFEDGEALVVPFDPGRDDRGGRARPGRRRVARAAFHRRPAAATRPTWDDVAASRSRSTARRSAPSRRPRSGARPAPASRCSARSPSPARAPASRAHRAPAVRVARELAERRPRGDGVARADEHAVAPVLEQIVRGADAIRQDEREPARRRLVDDDAPRLVGREQGEHVGDRIALGDPVPFDVRQHDEAHALGARSASSALARGRCPRGAARADGRPRPRRPGRACRGPSPARAARRRGRRRRRARDPPRPGAPPGAGASASARAPNPLTSIVSAKTSMRSGSAPRASIDSRASVPTTRTCAAPRTIAGTTLAFTARRHPGRSSRSFDSTSSTYGTRRRRHHAIAAWEANVLQPDATTTSGRASPSARTTPSESGSHGAARAARGRARPRGRRPGGAGRAPIPAAGRSRRVQRGEVDLGARGEASSIGFR